MPWCGLSHAHLAASITVMTWEGCGRRLWVSDRAVRLLGGSRVESCLRATRLALAHVECQNLWCTCARRVLVAKSAHVGETTR